MSKIKKITAHEILDSRGNPTVEAVIELADGITTSSSAPSGGSRGLYEAAEIRDGDEARYAGLGVMNAIKNINEVIGPKIEGMDIFEQQKIDQAMIEVDGTQNKSKLGGNAILAVSQAVAEAGAKSAILPTSLYLRQFVSGNLGKKIPTPMFSMLEGGNHGGNSLNFREFLIIPATSKSLSESLQMSFKIYKTLRKIIFEKDRSTLVAAKGGYSPALGNNQEGLAIIRAAIDQSELSFALDVFMGLDAGANFLLDGKSYKISDRSSSYTSSDLADFYKSLIAEFSLIYLEDPFGVEDWEAWKKSFSALSEKTLIGGGDLVTTNPYRLQLALDGKVINALVVKPNQIGTVTEAIAVVEIARFKGLKIVVSDRSGESMDSFIADFAVGVGADYVKFGAAVRERVLKYNKLIRIESEISKI